MQIHVIENIIQSLLYETRKYMLIVNRTRINFGFVYALSGNLQKIIPTIDIIQRAIFLIFHIFSSYHTRSVQFRIFKFLINA